MLETADRTETEILERLHSIEERLARLEAWRAAGSPRHEELPGITHSETAAPSSSQLDDLPDFNLSYVGRTLIVLGGAFLLRAMTEGKVIPLAAGIALGLAYAALWSILAFRLKVPRSSGFYHGLSTLLVGAPLIFEATRKFEVFGEWTSGGVLTGLSAIVALLAWRRQIHALGWALVAIALPVVLLLMGQTSSMAAGTVYLLGLGITTLWMGYILDWRLLRWPVAFELNGVLGLLAFLVATGRLKTMHPAVAILLTAGTFAVYLINFALRTIARDRKVIGFEIGQMITLLFTGVGAALWVSAATSTLVIPLAVGTLLTALAMYAVSFVFAPRHFENSINFTVYSTLALVLTLCGGAFVAKGIGANALWSALAVATAFFAARVRRTSLAFHSVIYLFAGIITAEVPQMSIASLFAESKGSFPSPAPGALLVLVAAALAVALPRIGRKDNYEDWSLAKLFLMTELGWCLATFAMCAFGSALLSGKDSAMIAVARTALLSLLTVVTAWVARYPRFSPGRLLSAGMLAVLAVKLVADDFRVGRPSTMFLSFVIVGTALIVTTRLRRASGSEPAVVAA